MDTVCAIHIFNTWVKLLSRQQLKSLVFWPPKDLVQQSNPQPFDSQIPEAVLYSGL